MLSKYINIEIYQLYVPTPQCVCGSLDLYYDRRRDTHKSHKVLNTVAVMYVCCSIYFESDCS